MESNKDKNIKSLNDLKCQSINESGELEPVSVTWNSALQSVGNLLLRKKEQLQKEYTAYNAAKINLINELLK